jgi:hypothetical protein
MNYDDLIKLIASGDLTPLIGTSEGQFFDAKRDLYVLQTDAQKLEFAKDVSAFANADGGVIFIGVQAEETPTNLGGKVIAITAVPKEHIDMKQYHDLLKEWIYPNPKDVAIKWIDVTSTPDQGVLCIVIPKQADEAKPFLITKNFIDNERQKGILFGYAERSLDRSEHLKHPDLQRLLHAGMFYEKNMDARLTTIETAVLKPASPAPVLPSKPQPVNAPEGSSKKSPIVSPILGTEKIRVRTVPPSLLAGRIGEALEVDEVDKKKLVIFSAHVDGGNELMTVFATPNDEKSVAYKLTHTAPLRRDGWSLETTGPARIIEGEFIRATNGSRKVIDLYRDGTLIFVASAEEEFLGWGKEFAAEEMINPLAFIEATYSFAKFYREVVIPDLARKITGYKVRVDIHIPAKRNMKLPPYSITSLQGRHEAHDAPKHFWDKERAFVSESKPELVSYQMAKEIYLWFGFDESKIPYTKTENDITLTDVQKILGPHNGFSWE